MWCESSLYAITRKLVPRNSPDVVSVFDVIRSGSLGRSGVDPASNWMESIRSQFGVDLESIWPRTFVVIKRVAPQAVAPDWCHPGAERVS